MWIGPGAEQGIAPGAPVNIRDPRCDEVVWKEGDRRRLNLKCIKLLWVGKDGGEELGAWRMCAVKHNAFVVVCFVSCGWVINDKIWVSCMCDVFGVWNCWYISREWVGFFER